MEQMTHVSTPEQKANILLVDEPQSILIHNMRRHLTTINTGKQFICKGKHQYTEVLKKEGSIIKSNWICQCGKNMRG